jgi:hypothetical protein
LGVAAVVITIPLAIQPFVGWAWVCLNALPVLIVPGYAAKHERTRSWQIVSIFDIRGGLVMLGAVYIAVGVLAFTALPAWYRHVALNVFFLSYGTGIALSEGRFRPLAALFVLAGCFGVVMLLRSGT